MHQLLTVLESVSSRASYLNVHVLIDLAIVFAKNDMKLSHFSAFMYIFFVFHAIRDKIDKCHN